MREELYRALPSTDRVLRTAGVAELRGQFARRVVVGLVREVLAEARAGVNLGLPPPELADLERRVVERSATRWRVSPRPVINATGVILHTNLGRSPLSEAAIQAVVEAARYSDLEFDLESGERSSRQDASRQLLQTLTGAGGVHVATNTAAAVTLALAALARGKEVIVSRGQAVEIGGGFRVPVVLRQSGARLVEVGTTNRTGLSDYEEAISPRTAAILHVHTSNFRVVGFTEGVPLRDLAELAHARGLLLLDDNGSGALLDTARFGLAHEPTPLESLQAGSDVVAFSGDKLLGGPQAGVLLGGEEQLRAVSRHPLARATRPDKLALAALSGTLLAYIRGSPERELPVWRMISCTARQLAVRAGQWQRRLADEGVRVELIAGESTVGGGSLPGETLPTTLVVLPAGIRSRRLREAPLPVAARTSKDRVVLDPRTVLEAEEESLFEALRWVLTGRGA